MFLWQRKTLKFLSRCHQRLSLICLDQVVWASRIRKSTSLLSFLLSVQEDKFCFKHGEEKSVRANTNHKYSEIYLSFFFFFFLYKLNSRYSAKSTHQKTMQRNKSNNPLVRHQNFYVKNFQCEGKNYRTKFS